MNNPILRLSLFVFLLCCHWITNHAQNPMRNVGIVKDINVSPEDFPALSSYTLLDSHFYFVKSFTELWKSDGTKKGTQRIQDTAFSEEIVRLTILTKYKEDLIFYTFSSDPFIKLWKLNSYTHEITLLKSIINIDIDKKFRVIAEKGSELFFRNNGELWKTSGTPESTKLVKTFFEPNANADLREAVVFKNSVYLVTMDAIGGVQLWKLDEPADTAKMIKRINTEINYNSPTQFVIKEETLYFLVHFSPLGQKLWKSDGTTEGTVTVTNNEFQNVENKSLILFKNFLFFSADDRIAGKELWKSDGTASGTVLLKDISTGNGGSFPTNLTVVKDKLYFSAFTFQSGQELWVSDGSTVNTQLVRDILPGERGSNPRNITLIGDNVFFVANDILLGGDVWMTDGTGSGTKIIKDVTGNSQFAPTTVFTTIDQWLYFGAWGENSGFELWRTDGKESNTNIIKDIHPGTGLSPFGISQYLFNLQKNLIFIGNDHTHGYELWRSNGTVEGTLLIVDLFLNPHSADPDIIGKNNDFILFNANSDGVRGIWKTDGTSNGTVPIKEMPLFLTEPSVTVNNIIYFKAYTEEYGYELWRSDGTASGTRMVIDIYPGKMGSNPNELTVVGSIIYFTAEEELHGREIWKTDGTSEGTRMIKVIYDGGKNIYTPKQLLKANNLLFFIAYDEQNEFQLWRSDGTAAGTFNLAPIPHSVTQGDLIEYKNQLFFTRATDESPTTLWKTNGSVEGTIKVKSFLSGSYEPMKYPILCFSFMFFVIKDNPHGTELWKTDGTEEGTLIVHDKILGEEGSFPQALTPVGNKLYFIARDGPPSYSALFVHDASISETKQLHSMQPDLFSEVSSFTELDGVLYFVYNDPGYGRELWQTQGEVENTFMVKDIYSGLESSLPLELITFKNELYFTAWDGVTGRELYKVSDCLTDIQGFESIKNLNCSPQITLQHFKGSNYSTSWKLLEVQDSAVRIEEYELFSVFTGIPGKNYKLELMVKNLYCGIIKDTLLLKLDFNDQGVPCKDVILPYNSQNIAFEQLKVFPNPACCELNFDFHLNLKSDIRIRLIDVSGREFVDQKYPAVGAGHQRLKMNLTHLPVGIYFSTLQSEFGMVVKKVLIE